jgi:primosomal replication protein N
MIITRDVPVSGHMATVATYDEMTGAAVCVCGLTAVSTPKRVLSLLRRKHVKAEKI